MAIKTNDKRFDPREHQENDSKAKNVVMEFLSQLGFGSFEENLGEANRDFSRIWDLKAENPNLKNGKWRVDAEIKRDWGVRWADMPFRFSTMDIPFRKRDKAKKREDGEEHATHHIVVGGDLERLFIVPRRVLKDEDITSVTEKPCRNRDEPEPFFNVPIFAEGTSFWFKKDGKWRPYFKNSN